MSIPDPIVLLDARARYVHPAMIAERASTQYVVSSGGLWKPAPVNALPWSNNYRDGVVYQSQPTTVNQIANSFDWTSGWSTSNVSITAGQAVGPDGELSLNRITENTNNDAHYTSITGGFPVPDNDYFTYWCVAKQDERRQLILLCHAGGDFNTRMHVMADLNDGIVISTVSTGGSDLLGAGCEDLGGGLWRVWLSGRYPAGVTSSSARVQIAMDGATIYQGDGSSGLYAGFAQCEHNRGPTSYIKTEGSTATRIGGTLYLPEVPAEWRPNVGGTLLVQYRQPHIHRSFGRLIDVLDVQSNVSWFCARHDSVTNSLMVLGDALGSSVYVTFSPTGRHTFALAWDQENAAVAYDGSIVNQQSIVSPLPQDVALAIASQPPLSTRAGLFDVARCVYYPQRLSNADLQSLTALQE